MLRAMAKLQSSRDRGGRDWQVPGETKELGKIAAPPLDVEGVAKETKDMFLLSGKAN
jgi:hypothetical protein